MYDPAVIAALASFLEVENTPEAVLDALQRLMNQLSPDTAMEMDSEEFDPEAVKEDMVENEKELTIELEGGKSATLKQLKDALEVQTRAEVVTGIATLYKSIKQSLANAQPDLSALKTAINAAKNSAPATTKAPALIPDSKPRQGLKQSPRYGMPHVHQNVPMPSLGTLALDLIAAKRSGSWSKFNQGLKAGNYQEGILGGFVVAEQYSNELITMLREQLWTEKAGARVSDASDVATILIPKMTDATDAYWVGVNEQVTASDAEFAQLVLNPKPIATRYLVPIRMQQTLRNGIADRVNTEMIKSISIGIDRACLVGTGGVTGSNSGAEPVGLLNISGVTQTQLATNGRVPTFEDLESMFSRIEEADVELLGGTDKFVMNPRDWNTFKNMTDANGQPLLVPNYSEGVMNNNIYGHEVLRTNLVPKNITTGTNSNTSYIFAGEFRYMELVLAGGIELMVNDQTRASYLQTEVIAYTHADMAVHHPEAFEVLTGVAAS